MQRMNELKFRLRAGRLFSRFLSRSQQLCKFIQSACYVACIQVILHYPNNEETLPIRNRRFHLRILRFPGRCYDLDRETTIPGLISSIQRFFHRIYDKSLLSRYILIIRKRHEIWYYKSNSEISRHLFRIFF